jgi:hypothetical protein
VGLLWLCLFILPSICWCTIDNITIHSTPVSQVVSYIQVLQLQFFIHFSFLWSHLST